MQLVTAFSTPTAREKTSALMRWPAIAVARVEEEVRGKVAPAPLNKAASGTFDPCEYAELQASPGRCLPHPQLDPAVEPTFPARAVATRCFPPSNGASLTATIGGIPSLRSAPTDSATSPSRRVTSRASRSPSLSLLLLTPSPHFSSFRPPSSRSHFPSLLPRLEPRRHQHLLLDATTQLSSRTWWTTRWSALGQG
ncbi:hypothetical protein BJY59DRAFT_205795 [Rhodotorula toruloides]